MTPNMSDEAKAFLKAAIAAGGIYTTPIHPTFQQAIKEKPYGKPRVRKHVSFLSRLFITYWRCLKKEV